MRKMCSFRLYLLLFLIAAMSAPGPARARDSGWVPLETNKAKNLTVPLKRQAPTPLVKGQKSKQPEQGARNLSVYENQPPVTEMELESFVLLLPRFRKWARSNGEDAHPIVNSAGEPDFKYSPKAAQWVTEHNFDPLRFFCVMGRLAAGMVVVEEGNDFKGTRPADMPGVSAQELGLVRKHLGELLAASAPHAPVIAD